MPDILAIHGGEPVRKQPFPARGLFDASVFKAVNAFLEETIASGQDFGFQGKHETAYTEAFAQWLEGGYADAVCSGSVALFLALKALNLPQGAKVLITAVTDPGAVSAVIYAGFEPIPVDTAKGYFNANLESVQAAFSSEIRAVIVTHLGGWPTLDLNAIADLCNQRKVPLIEDASQAHGSTYRGQRVGTFGTLAVFSTMFSKAHSTGGCGGVIFTRDKTLYQKVRSLADRGKPFFSKNFDPKNPNDFEGPALNFNNNELGCLIGLITFKKLPQTIAQRTHIVFTLNKRLKESCLAVEGYQQDTDSQPFYFFHTLKINTDILTCDKATFTQALQREGISLNPHYQYVFTEWPWVKQLFPHIAPANNAIAFRNQTCNLLFNENLQATDIEDIIRAICKVEQYYLKDKSNR